MDLVNECANVVEAGMTVFSCFADSLKLLTVWMMPYY